MTREALAVAFVALFLGACASVPAPATRSPQSPAHPSAPEAVTPAAEPVLTQGDAEASAAPTPPGPRTETHEGHAKPLEHPAPRPDAAYTCPMHPLVKADEPGSCPICGMTLAAKKPAPPEGGGWR